MEYAQHLCDFLPLSEARDLTLVFEDGRLEVDKIIILAVSSMRETLAECDLLIIQSQMVVGQHLMNLLTRGQTEISESWIQNEIQFLLASLQIEMNIDLTVDICDFQHTFANIESIETIETIDTFVETVDTGDAIDTNICDIGGDLSDLTSIIITAAIEAEKPIEEQQSKKKPDKILYECDLDDCRLMFEGITQFRKHTNEVHNARPLACPEKGNGCKFRADDHNKVECHMRGVHKELYSENVTCDLCQRVFSSKSYLKSHIRRMHKKDPAEREKTCPYCGEIKLQLNDHIMRAHKQRRFFCDLCPKSFKTSVQRRIHRNVHTGFRPYTCQTCDQTFARLHHRKIHLKKTGHLAGPVLKPDDHVDYRTIQPSQPTVVTDDLLAFVDSNQEILDASEQLKREFGVNCAEIIENITFPNEVLGFE